MIFWMVQKSEQMSPLFCHNKRVWQTDGNSDRWTEGFLVASPCWHSMQRGKHEIRCFRTPKIPWDCVPHPSALEVCSRQGAIKIHVYLYLTLPVQPQPEDNNHTVWITTTNKKPTWIPVAEHWQRPDHVEWHPVSPPSSCEHHLSATAHTLLLQGQTRWRMYRTDLGADKDNNYDTMHM